MPAQSLSTASKSHAMRRAMVVDIVLATTATKTPLYCKGQIEVLKVKLMKLWVMIMINIGYKIQNYAAGIVCLISCSKINTLLVTGGGAAVL